MRRTLLVVLLASLALIAAGCGKQLPTQTQSRSSSTALESVAGNTVNGVGGAIGNFVWNDLNGNGIQDAGEPGIPNVIVALVRGDIFITEKPTDANGFYEFTDLEPGTYTVVVKPPACPPTKSFVGAPDKDSNESPATVTIDGQRDDTIDFGFVCKNPPKGECAKCEGKVSALTLRYNGTSTADIRVEQKKPKLTVFHGTVPAGGSFSFVGRDKKGTLGTEISIYVNGVLNVKIHTSCSQPIGPGMVKGAFEIIAGESRNGGPLCPLPPPPPGGDDFCADRPGRPARLEMRYTGEGCGATHHTQADGKVFCTDFGTLPANARIVATDSSTPGSGNVWFDGVVAIDGTFTINAANAGQTRLSTNTWVYLYDGATLVEKVQFHTSCSQPLLRGDEYGSLMLEGFGVTSVLDSRGLAE